MKVFEKWQFESCKESTNNEIFFHSEFIFEYVNPIEHLIKNPFYKNCESFIQRFIRSGLKSFLNVCVYKKNKSERSNNKSALDYYNYMYEQPNYEFYAKVVSNCFKNIEETTIFHTIQNQRDETRNYYGYNIIVNHLLKEFPENNTISKIMLPLCGNSEQNYTIDAFQMLFKMKYYTCSYNNEWRNKIEYKNMSYITTEDIYLDNGEHYSNTKLPKLYN